MEKSFLETTPIPKLMRKYAVPCVISLLVAALYNIVDQIFIANASYLGSNGNAANTGGFSPDGHRAGCSRHDRRRLLYLRSASVWAGNRREDASGGIGQRRAVLRDRHLLLIGLLSDVQRTAAGAVRRYGQ